MAALIDMEEIMTKNILRVVKKFLKGLHYQVNFETVKSYLAKMGYIIMFYGSQGDESGILRKNGLLDYSQKVPAITIDDDDYKVVFLNSKNSSNDLLCALLHETGHIMLGHLKKRKNC